MVGSGAAARAALLAAAAAAALASVATAVTIREIQMGSEGESPLDGEVVVTEGVVTFSEASWAFIQDGTGEYSGILLSEPSPSPARGDRVRVTGAVGEDGGATVIASPTVEVLEGGAAEPPPMVLGAADARAEGWEAVLVQIRDCTVVEEKNGFGDFVVEDAAGDRIVVGDWGYDVPLREHEPRVGDTFSRITGVIDFYFEYMIVPRERSELVSPDPPPASPPRATTIRGVQTPPAGGGSASGLEGVSVSVEGVVTFKAGGYAFIQEETPLSEPPAYSGLLLYQPEVEGGGELRVGDRVNAIGAVAEYYGGTEIPHAQVEVLASGVALPPAKPLATGAAGDERWEGVRVALSDVAVPEGGGKSEFGIFSVDDGSGPVKVDDLGYDPRHTHGVAEGDEFESIVGPAHFFQLDGGFKIYPQSGSDVVYAGSQAPGSAPERSIREIQEGSVDKSEYDGEIVRTRGVVTATVEFGAGEYAFIQDGSGAWSGLILYEPWPMPRPGDAVSAEGEVNEYFGCTELVRPRVSALAPADASALGEPAPVLVTTSEAAVDEGLEGVLVEVRGVEVEEAAGDSGGDGDYALDDGSGQVPVSTAAYAFEPPRGHRYGAVVAVVDHFAGAYLLPRGAGDFVEDGDEVPEPESPCGLAGDINFDGTRNVVDAVVLVSVVIGRVPHPQSPGSARGPPLEGCPMVGDGDCDGRINIVDVVALLQVVLGRSDNLCPGTRQP